MKLPHRLYLVYMLCAMACIPLAAQVSQTYTLDVLHARQAGLFHEMSAYSGAAYHAGQYRSDLPLGHSAHHRTSYLTHNASTTLQSDVLRGIPALDDHALLWVKKHRSLAEARSAAYTLGYEALYQGNDRLAFDYFAAVEPRDPDDAVDAAIAYERGRLKLDRRLYEDAEADLTFVTEGQSCLSARAHFHLGSVAEQQDDADAAIAHYKKVRGDTLYGPSVPYRLARIYSAQGDQEAVLRVGQPALEKRRTKDAAALRQLVGRAHYELGNTQEALSYMSADEVNTVSPSSPNDQYRVAQLYYEKGDFAAAKTAFTRLAHREDKIGEQAAYFLAYSAIQEGDLLKAKQAYSHISRTTDDMTRRHEAIYNDGLLSAELGRDREAAQSLATIPSTATNYDAARDALYQVVMGTEDVDGALAVLENSADRSPKLDEARQLLYLRHGIAALERKAYDAAMLRFSSSLSYPVLVDRALDARYLQGYTAYQAGQSGEAAVALQRYRTQATGTQHDRIMYADYLLGMIAFDAGRYAEAEPLLLDASKRAKGSQLEDDLAVRLGDCAFQRRQFDTALTHYLRALELDADHVPYARYQAGTIRDLQGSAVEALVLLERVPDLHPASEWAPRALLDAGRIYLKLGRFDEAATPLQRLITHYRTSDSYIDGLLLMGLVSYNSGATARAKSYYEQVVDLQGTPVQTADAYRALEEIYVKDMKDPQGYISYIEAKTGQDVSTMKRDSLIFASAEGLYRDGEHLAAIEAMSDYLEKHPIGIYQDKAKYARAMSYLQLDLPEAAYKDLADLAARAASPFHERALTDAGWIAHEVLRDYPASVRWNAMIAADQADRQRLLSARQRLLVAYHETSDHDACLATADLLLSDETTPPHLIDAANYYGGTSALRLGRSDDALKRLQKLPALADNTWDEEATYLIAQIHIDRGDSSGAHAALDRLISGGAGAPGWVARAILLKSDLNLQSGRLFEAKAGLEAILTHFDQDADITAEVRRMLTQVQQALDARDQLDSNTIQD